MDISIFTDFIVKHCDVFIVLCCYVLGNIIKKWDKVDNEFIMFINAIVGVGLAICFNSFAVDMEIIKVGVCSGIGATAVHELIKNGLSILNRA